MACHYVMCVWLFRSDTAELADLLVLAVMPGDGSVGRFGLDGLAVGTHQYGGHQPQRAETCEERALSATNNHRGVRFLMKTTRG